MSGGEVENQTEQRLREAEIEIDHLRRRNADLQEELMSTRGIVKALTPMLKKTEENNDIITLQVN